MDDTLAILLKVIRKRVAKPAQDRFSITIPKCADMYARGFNIHRPSGHTSTYSSSPWSSSTLAISAEEQRRDLPSTTTYRGAEL